MGWHHHQTVPNPRIERALIYAIERSMVDQVPGTFLYTFEDHVQELEPTIRSNEDIEDLDLLKIWGFSIDYFFSQSHGDNMARWGVPIEEARLALIEAVRWLRKEVPELPPLIVQM